MSPQSVEVEPSAHDSEMQEEKKHALHNEAVDRQTAQYTAGAPIEIDAATNKRLFWKINRRILTIQLITYFCQSLDKGTLNFASIMGIKKDANLVGQEIGGLLAFVLGLATCVWSVCIGLFLPDNPMTAKCYTEDEKRLMIERVRHNETGIQNRQFKKPQFVEALTDPFVWCCVMLITVANLVIGGLGVFSNLIIREFGFSLLQTQLLNIAQGVWTIIVMVGSAQASQKSGQTCLTMILWTIPAVVGTVVILIVKPTPSNSGGMLIAFYCTQFFLAQGNMIISLVTRNVAGQTKKSTTMTMVFIGWAVGNLIAPQIFQEKDAPRYLPGFLVHIGVYAAYLCLVVVTRIVLMARNRRKDAEATQISHDLAFQDLTDVKNPNFLGAAYHGGRAALAPPVINAVAALQSMARLPVLVKHGQKRCYEGIEESDRRARDKVLTPPKDDEMGVVAGAYIEIDSNSDTSIEGINPIPFFDVSVELKIWGVAARGLRLRSPPTNFPEYTKPGETDYVYRDLEFWTSGFFPGSLHLLLERKTKFGHVLKDISAGSPGFHGLQLEFACKYWTENLHQNAHLRDTHDLGFMIMPWAKVAHEINHDLRALETIKTAAKSLLSRYNEKIGFIRSWDKCITKKYNFHDTDSDFMVIIVSLDSLSMPLFAADCNQDNMMNLDLLFYAASKTGDERMYAAAVSHARMTARTHIRQDGSTTHLVVLDTKDGTTKYRLTNQGYSHTSCWARGQSWAIAGFAQTYNWTRDVTFLEVACRCADYFMSRLPESGIVLWDFDAPVLQSGSQPSDVSAAMIASYGMLLIHQALLAREKSSSYLQYAMILIRAVCAHHINPPATLVSHETVVETVEHGKSVEQSSDVEMGEGDTILKGATINNYEFAPRRWADHGLVYADYYFLLVGNKLLELGFVLNQH
ncbi:hypothetical protein OPT61_g4035 [Boeremia exigua]|uniref:Uncharacterized protein n=1 Tax=Boeremia exigua TaxID=749465 RepID=A0ACC2IFT0_9PLEO|nr:hypothetical protein OPT61_g4035 [Boeremia exigua]